MRIDRRSSLVAVFTALLVPAAAHAASFDCTRATSAAEKRICADPQLSRADEALAVAYGKALAAAPLPFAVRADQRRWIGEMRDKAATNADLLAGMNSRMAELALQTAADRVAASPVPLASIATRCTAPQTDDGVCKVEASGRLPSVHLAWQRRVYHDGETRVAGGVTIYAIEGVSARPIVWRDEEDGWFDDPELIATPVGTLLDLPGHSAGTGNFSVEAVLAADGGDWRQLDIDGITDGLTAHVPHGRGIWKGVYPDWRHMTADSPLWKDSDGNCCPTGGSVRGTLKRVGLRIVVDRAVYDPKPLAD